MSDSQPKMYVLRNDKLEAHISTQGGIIHRLLVKDANGHAVDVALGHAEAADYLTSGTYFGSVCGRAANRIAGGRYTSGSSSHQLSQNDGSNHLHGGNEGWDKKIWRTNEVPGKSASDQILKLSLTSPNGDEGYPGTAEASIIYRLTQNTLRAIFEADADRETPINIVQHCYFNLGGHQSGDILDHSLTINATHYTPKDKDNAGVIPTGDIVPVDGTAFDFSKGKPIGRDFAQLKGGYDHNFVLFGNAGNVKDIKLSRAKQSPDYAALLQSPKTGIAMKVCTTAPGLQVYTGGFLSDVKGKDGVIHQAAGGVCLETQGFPNAVNQSSFPSTLVAPGQHYFHEVSYEFSCI